MTHPRSVPVFASSVTFPSAMTCWGARLTAASMFSDVPEGRLAYVSFTRAQSTLRSALVHDDALPHALDLLRHWRESLAAAHRKL